MRFLFAFVFIFSAGVVFSQDTEVRHIDDFEAVKVSHGIEVVLVAGTQGKIEVDTYGIDPGDIETYVSRGVLRIKFRTNSIFDWEDRYDRRDVRIEVPYEVLYHIESNTGALVKSKGVIKGRDLSLESSTGGEMELELDVNRVDAEFNMGSVAEVSGKAGVLRIKASMGADVDFRELESEVVEAKGNMGAMLSVYASREADITSNMGSMVSVYGSPERRYNTKTFGGEIEWEGHY